MGILDAFKRDNIKKLAKQAIHDTDANVRNEARDKMCDVEFLSALAERKCRDQLWTMDDGLIGSYVNGLYEQFKSEDEASKYALQEFLLYQLIIQMRTISGEDRLKRYALEGKSWLVRSAAVKRIEDQGFLDQVVRTDADKCVKFAAIGRIHDQSVLAGLLKDKIPKEDWIVGIMLQVQDEEIITKFLLGTPVTHYTGRRLVRKISDPDNLTKLSNNGRKKHVKAAAAMRLLDEHKLVGALAREIDMLDAVDVASLSPDSIDRVTRVCTSETDKLKVAEQTDNQELLGQLAMDGHDINLRLQATRLLKDTEVIKRVYSRFAAWKETEDGHILGELMNKVDDQDLLKLNAEKSNSLFVRQQAIRRIRDVEFLKSHSKGLFAAHPLDAAYRIVTLERHPELLLPTITSARGIEWA